MRVWPFALLVLACDSEPDRPPLGELRLDAQAPPTADARVAVDASIPDQAVLPPVGGVRFDAIVLVDESEGLGIGNLGVDVDAVSVRCGADTVWATEADPPGPGAAALGAPDGASVHLNPGAELALGFGRDDLTGCAVAVEELDHADGEVVRIWACPELLLTNDCRDLGAGLTAVVQ